ncbi:MAG: DNA-directed RNA polymerase subunit beta', partial [Kiritimatiellae bacterium]|nr:DNA-directed RNA polymerase subunit beta' [Kiritimatiellia bacterium]
DQMAVHVPLSVEAQLESRLLMMSSNSIFSPASGRSIMTPTQDIALGIYYLTVPGQQDKLAGRMPGKVPFAAGEHVPIFGSADEVTLAYAERQVRIHTRIRFRNPDFGRDTRYGNKNAKLIETTVGRVIFNEVWPPELGFVNDKIDKGKLGDLILNCHQVAGHARTVRVLDDLKSLGFEHACLAGVSMGLKDMIRPKAKDDLLAHAQREVDKVEKQLQIGVITDGERHNKIIDIWTTAHEKVADELYRAIDQNVTAEQPKPLETNPVYMMVDSKARGSKAQIRQLAGMRGLMAKPSGEIIERPITASFREGLSVLEYFVSSHGARKGLADTALKTADAGYLTRKLVGVAQDVIIVMQDCNTVNGIEIEAISEGNEGGVPLRQRILGRTALHDVLHPVTGDVLLRANEEVDEAACKRIDESGIESVWIRSGLTCDARHGMCAKCYGRDLSTGQTVEIGTAVGIVAAQSIGEPGTQLTMRTFHIGGTAQAVVATPEIVVRHEGVLHYEDDLRWVRSNEGENIVLNKNGAAVLRDAGGRELERITLQIGTALLVENGGAVKGGQRIAHWDPHSVPVLAEKNGVVSFHDFVEDVTVRSDRDEQTGMRTLVIMDTREALHPQIVVTDPATSDVLGFYHIPAGAHVMVKEGERVSPGKLLAKTPRKEAKTRDITGGLPRVAELFEARHPKDAADIAKIEGVVDFGPNQRGRRCLIIRDEVTNAAEEHLIPMGKHIVVFKGDRVKKGQQLTEGPIVPQEILDVCGPQELQRYLVNEVQQVYRLQGVEINDKHIEIIVRQMLRKVRISNPGDTDFLWGEQVTRQHFIEINEQVAAEGKRPAEAQPALLGITKASLETDSFISAASFQDTTRVLTDAATMGRVDELRGFKENVILGHLIPGGTGFPMHRYIKLVPLAEPIEPEELAPAAVDEAQRKAQDVIGLNS